MNTKRLSDYTYITNKQYFVYICINIICQLIYVKVDQQRQDLYQGSKRREEPNI